MRHTVLLLGAAAVAAATLAFESDAAACGGCFHTPGESPTLVTDHRMILSVSQDQTTLYDQIKYTGAPASFAWVLPVSGEIEVGLSADVVFGTLDTLSATFVVQPPLNCPSRPESCDEGNFGDVSASAGRAADGGVAGVQVTKQEVVGPYQTVQLHSTDPAALETWLSQNGFALPADMKPVVDEYVKEHFDFLALKLLPQKGVQDMRPVRVTTKGASAVLPLRMVAAGAGATVGITLWVIGEGRYEPTNFPWFHIADADIAWDWNLSRSNYTDLRAQKGAELAGRGWELESALAIQEQLVVSTVANGGQAFPSQLPGTSTGDYAPVLDGQGGVVKTEEQVRDEDLETLFHGIQNGEARVTRLRSDVARAALATDLTLNASSDQSVLSNQRIVTKELNQPLCPVYVNCKQAGTAPRDQAAAASSGNGDETFSCSTKHGRRNSEWLAAGLAFVAIAITRTIRRRRR